MNRKSLLRLQHVVMKSKEKFKKYSWLLHRQAQLCLFLWTHCSTQQIQTYWLDAVLCSKCQIIFYVFVLMTGKYGSVTSKVMCSGIFGCDSSPRSPNASPCVCLPVRHTCYNCTGLLKDFQRTLWSTKFTSLQVAAPRSSRLFIFYSQSHVWMKP